MLTTEHPWLIGLVVLFAVAGIYGCIQWFRMFNSPDGERYSRLVTQGDMVPANDADD